MVAVTDLVLAVKLGILANARAGREQLVAIIEGRQVAATLALASLASPPFALPLFNHMPCSTFCHVPAATRLLGEHLRIGDVAIQAGDLRLHARGWIQKKRIIIIEGSHTTALIASGKLKRLAIERIGRTGTTTLVLRPPLGTSLRPPLGTSLRPPLGPP